MICKEDIHLEGKNIKLQKLNVDEDFEELYEISHGDEEKEEIWLWFDTDKYEKPFKNKQIFKDFLIDHYNNAWYTFTVIDKKSGKKIGNVGCINDNLLHKRIEIGGWYGKKYHGGYTNTETMFLMLNYIFDILKYRRIEWKTDSNNIASKKAALKLGFIHEGTFR